MKAFADVCVVVDPLLALSLPGSRDRGGRAVLQVCARAQVWAGESCTVNDLTCLLGYYYSTLRSVMTLPLCLSCVWNH